jgi:hypothetical protein
MSQLHSDRRKTMTEEVTMQEQHDPGARPDDGEWFHEPPVRVRRTQNHGRLGGHLEVGFAPSPVLRYEDESPLLVTVGSRHLP